MELIFCFILIIIIICFLLLNRNSLENYTNNDIINFIHIPKNAGTSIKDLCNDKLIYNGHQTDVFNQELSNQLVILRNPIERFVSSVNYSLEIYSYNENVKRLKANKIDTPDKWITIWKNKNHQHHNMVMKQIYNSHHDNVKNKNYRHLIGNTNIKYKWTYTPQVAWFNKPKYILIMDNLDEEMEYICNKLNIPYNLKKKNSTTKKDKIDISDKNLKWINNFYKEDWKLYNKYKNIPFKDRINL